jgi:hypothetical protein
METYKKVIWVSVIIAVVLIVPLIVYFFFLKGEAPAPPPPSPKPEVRAPVSPAVPGKDAAAKDEPTEPAPLAVPLNNSDEPMRELLKDCSPHPRFGRWVKNKDIIRRFAAVVDNVANGESPTPHLEFLAPTEKFTVIKRGDNIYLDPAAYGRYNRMTAILTSLQTKKLVEIYRQTKPLIKQAYKELGYPGKDFGKTLFQAFSVILDTPVIGSDIELLEEKVTAYAFADPGLENLSAAQKHLLRMGPENIKKIQAKIREVISEMRRK